MYQKTIKITLAFLVIFVFYSNGYAATRLLYENFDDQTLSRGLVVFGANWARLSPPQYNLNSTGRGGSGHSFTSGTISEAHISWFENLPSPWPSNELYVSYWMRYPTFQSTDTHENIKIFYPHWNGTQSYVHYSMSSNNTVYYSARGDGEMISLSNWISCPNQTDGNWHHYEFYVGFSTGISRFWYDGSLKLDHRYGSGAWSNNSVYYISAPSIDAEEDGTFSRQIDDWEVWDGMPDSQSSSDSSTDASGSTSGSDSTNDSGSAITFSAPKRLSLVSWNANSQTGDQTWTDSGVSWCVRALVKGEAVKMDGENIILGFQGRSSGAYTIRKVSIAEKDSSAQDGDIIDSTWKKVTFDGQGESTWGQDQITVSAGQVKRSDPISFNLSKGKDYYVTFIIESPSVYLETESGYSELYFEAGTDHSEDLDWSGNGHSVYMDRLHSLTSISVFQQ